jgi:hypothetical protein
MDRAGDREGTEKQTEGGELAEDQHPDHGIAGKIVQDSPARSLWFAIGCRHLLFRIRTPARPSSAVPIRVCCRTNLGNADQFLCAVTTSSLPDRGTKRRRFHGAASDDMSDAQIGLMTATPIIIVFAIALRRIGVLSTVATVSAVSISVAIAAVLFTTQ